MNEEINNQDIDTHINEISIKISNVFEITQKNTLPKELLFEITNSLFNIISKYEDSFNFQLKNNTIDLNFEKIHSNWKNLFLIESSKTSIFSNSLKINSNDFSKQKLLKVESNFTFLRPKSIFNKFFIFQLPVLIKNQSNRICHKNATKDNFLSKHQILKNKHEKSQNLNKNTIFEQNQENLFKFDDFSNNSFQITKNLTFQQNKTSYFNNNETFNFSKNCINLQKTNDKNILKQHFSIISQKINDFEQNINSSFNQIDEKYKNSFFKLLNHIKSQKSKIITLQEEKQKVYLMNNQLIQELSFTETIKKELQEIKLKFSQMKNIEEENEEKNKDLTLNLEFTKGELKMTKKLNKVLELKLANFEENQNLEDSKNLKSFHFNPKLSLISAKLNVIDENDELQNDSEYSNSVKATPVIKKGSCFSLLDISEHDKTFFQCFTFTQKKDPKDEIEYKLKKIKMFSKMVQTFSESPRNHPIKAQTEEECVLKEPRLSCFSVENSKSVKKKKLFSNDHIQKSIDDWRKKEELIDVKNSLIKQYEEFIPSFSAPFDKQRVSLPLMSSQLNEEFYKKINIYSFDSIKAQKTEISAVKKIASPDISQKPFESSRINKLIINKINRKIIDFKEKYGFLTDELNNKISVIFSNLEKIRKNNHFGKNLGKDKFDDHFINKNAQINISPLLTLKENNKKLFVDDDLERNVNKKFTVQEEIIKKQEKGNIFQQDLLFLPNYNQSDKSALNSKSEDPIFVKRPLMLSHENQNKSIVGTFEKDKNFNFRKKSQTLDRKKRDNPKTIEPFFDIQEFELKKRRYTKVNVSANFSSMKDYSFFANRNLKKTIQPESKKFIENRQIRSSFQVSKANFPVNFKCNIFEPKPKTKTNKILSKNDKIKNKIENNECLFNKNNLQKIVFEWSKELKTSKSDNIENFIHQFIECLKKFLPEDWLNQKLSIKNDFFAFFQEIQSKILFNKKTIDSLVQAKNDAPFRRTFHNLYEDQDLIESNNVYSQNEKKSINSMAKEDFNESPIKFSDFALINKMDKISENKFVNRCMNDFQHSTNFDAYNNNIQSCLQSDLENDQSISIIKIIDHLKNIFKKTENLFNLKSNKVIEFQQSSRFSDQIDNKNSISQNNYYEQNVQINTNNKILEILLKSMISFFNITIDENKSKIDDKNEQKLQNMIHQKNIKIAFYEENIKFSNDLIINLSSEIDKYKNKTQKLINSNIMYHSSDFETNNSKIKPNLNTFDQKKFQKKWFSKNNSKIEKKSFKEQKTKMFESEFDHKIYLSFAEKFMPNESQKVDLLSPKINKTFFLKNDPHEMVYKNYLLIVKENIFDPSKSDEHVRKDLIEIYRQMKKKYVKKSFFKIFRKICK